LLLVPAVKPQFLTTVFTYPLATALRTTINPYRPDTTTQQVTTAINVGVAPDLTKPFREPPTDVYLFGHLLNFFRQETTTAPSYPNPGYYRLFEFVEVPSRINGAVDPAATMTYGDTNIAGRRERVPGRMNINTIYEEEVFQAALNNYPFALGPDAKAWVRPITQIPDPNQGIVPQWATTATTGLTYADLRSELFRRVLLSIANPDADSGSENPALLFTPNDRPFRSFTVGATGAAAAGSVNRPPPLNIHSTFLRGLTDSGATAPTPVFEDDRGRRTGGTEIYYPPGILTGPNDDVLDYPYFRWLAMQKISNVFTTRSNVYAVWVTVGFFEVLNEDPSRLSGLTNAPPELGREINADIGKNIRHRAFFVIDRSRARGYAGPPRNSAELQDVLGQVVIHSRIIE
jgi:hypothetical protein